jgi:hypothetical protein
MKKDDGKVTFMEDQFLKSHKDKDIQYVRILKINLLQTLTKMFECQHYREFIEERIELFRDESFPTSPFEIKCSDVLPVAVFNYFLTIVWIASKV